MPERRSAAAQRYGRRIWPTMLSYVVLLVLAIWALESQAIGGVTRYAIALLPSIPLIGVIALVAQAISTETDEFQRAIWAEAVLWGTGTTMVATTVWGFLEMAGAPHVPLYWVFPFLTGATLIALVGLRRRYQ
jgi:hypothetical protein